MSAFELRIAPHEGLFVAVISVALFFFVIIFAETIFDLATGRRSGWRETLANFTIEIGNQLLERTIFGTAFVLGILFVEQFAVLSIPVTWWSWILALLAADFTYYWMHRIEHERRVFWAYHSVHHSSPEFNLTTSLRLSWVEGMVEWIFFIPMIMLGFDAVQIVGSILIVVVYQTWIHTEKIGRLGVLDRIFNTPSVHRVHHGRNPEYLDKNYGGILIIWDILFGTYQTEQAPVDYGVTQPLESSNPVTINFHEFWLMARDLLNVRKAASVWNVLFAPPGSDPN
ncbi:sterol desaturase family protein [Hyphomonas sp.]|uniref:sterol desaturase family protein n=1 Tax=Hyphomonas sp. TaxID=87 RepID=UPI0025C121FD|nr:sterol desaturase family protein [Hyphomonas sp.]